MCGSTLPLARRRWSREARATLFTSLYAAICRCTLHSPSISRPLFLYPTLADPDTRATLERRLASLTPAAQRRWGTMTAHEMLCHCKDLSKSMSGPKPFPVIVPPGIRSIIKRMALYSSLRWPHNLPTLPNANPNKKGTRPTDFNYDREQLIAEMHRFAVPRTEPIPRHPFFGGMTNLDWQRWGYLHLDFHLKQFGV